MSTSSPSNLEEAIRGSGEGWLIDWFQPPDQALSHIRQMLAAVNSRARERLGENAPDVSEEALLQEFDNNPQRVRGFFQALGGTRTPDMLLMAWRIIQGLEIKHIQMEYRRREAFSLSVILESPYGEADEHYLSTDIHDFALLRHVGILEIGGRPVFDGFYAMKLRPT